MKNLSLAILSILLLSCNVETYKIEGSWTLSDHYHQSDTALTVFFPEVGVDASYNYYFDPNNGSNFSMLNKVGSIINMGTTVSFIESSFYKNWGDGMVAFSPDGVNSIRAFEVERLTSNNLKLKLETSDFTEVMEFYRQMFDENFTVLT